MRKSVDLSSVQACLDRMQIASPRIRTTARLVDELLQTIEEKLADGWTYGDIASILSKECGIAVSPKTLANNVQRARKDVANAAS